MSPTTPPYRPPSSERRTTLPTLDPDRQSTPTQDTDTVPRNMQPERVFVPQQVPIQNDINYTQGYLQTQIGKFVRVEFLLGTNTLVDRTGILTKVGISYIVLQETGTGNEILCDIYSIKFVNIFPERTE